MQIRYKIICSINPILNSPWTVSSTLTFEILMWTFPETRRSFHEVNDCDAAMLLTDGCRHFFIYYLARLHVQDRARVYLWCCDAECRVGQLEPFLRFLSGQTSRFPQLLKLIRKLEDEKRDVCPPQLWFGSWVSPMLLNKCAQRSCSDQSVW